MSLRQRALEVQQRGAERRKTWSPSPNDTSVKIWQWWAEGSGNVIERENFCHFWRVVFIWAPLLLVRNIFEKYAPMRSVQVATVTAVAATIVGLSLLFGFVLVLLAIIAGIYVLTGLVLGVMLYNGKLGYYRNIKGSLGSVGGVLMLLTGPVVLLSYGLSNAYDSKARRWCARQLPMVFAGSLILAGASTVVVAITYNVIKYGWLPTLFFILILIATVVGFIAGVVTLAFLTGKTKDAVGMRRRTRRYEANRAWDQECRRRLDRALLYIFAYYHPEISGMSHKRKMNIYDRWVVRYEKRILRYGVSWSRIYDCVLQSNPTWDMNLRLSVHQFLQRQLLHSYPVVIIEEPRRSRLRDVTAAFKTTYRVVKELANLAFQAARASKWQICPIVEIPSEKVQLAK